MGSRVVLCGCVGFGVPVCACVCVGGGMLSGSGAVRPGCGLRGLCLSGVWRGVGCGGWVGCDLYSGREHHLIVFMRGMPGDR